MNKVTPVTCFCIYTPCMLINQHTNNPEVDLQIQNTGDLLFNNIQSKHEDNGYQVMPVSTINQCYAETSRQSFELFPAQNADYAQTYPAQSFNYQVLIFWLIVK